jgi:hypothetical protein
VKDAKGPSLLVDKAVKDAAAAKSEADRLKKLVEKLEKKLADQKPHDDAALKKLVSEQNKRLQRVENWKANGGSAAVAEVAVAAVKTEAAKAAGDAVPNRRLQTLSLQLTTSLPPSRLGGVASLRGSPRRRWCAGTSTKMLLLGTPLADSLMSSPRPYRPWPSLGFR